MATLVLSSVGTALGGPVGAAIGALIGQSIDQQLLGGGARGPRIGDLSVQTSSYGTQIPRVYGTMRVAGSIVWSTDLIEGTETAGAKGQPDTTFSYTVSFAVALSSRPIRSVGRIWADGKLIRGSDGVFKIPTAFRVHEGSESQAIDPLIASIEGIGTTPAYRGLALAVFENLDLAEFGNRIPFLTFEVIADEAPRTVAAIMADATDGLVQAECAIPITGFAAHGSSIGSAVAPLVEAFGLHLFDDGLHLRPAQQAGPMVIGNAILGNGAGDEQSARLELELAPATGLPASLRLAHYEPGNDFQSAEARASVSDQAGIEQRHELPAVIGSKLARSIAHEMLARRWAGREKLTLRLPPELLDLEPGSVVTLESDPGLAWRVERCTIDRFVVVAELRAHRQPVAAPAVAAAAAAASSAFASAPAEDSPSRVASTEGTSASNGLTLALFEIPAVNGAEQDQPTLLLAASSASPGWRARTVELTLGVKVMRVETARRKAVLGQLEGSLAAGSPRLLDTASAIEVQLIDPEQWLTSCDDAQIAAGSNLAVVGRELIQFGDAVPRGGGRFRLERLVRGVAGTIPGEHGPGAAFALLQPDRLRPIALPTWSKGAEAAAHARLPDGETVSAAISISGTPLTPPAPVHLSAERDGDGTLVIRWVRRSRSPAWVDEAGVPLCEQAEHYEVTLAGTAGSILLKAIAPEVRAGPTLIESLGRGPASVAVRQIGDWGASPPASSTVTL